MAVLGRKLSGFVKKLMKRNSDGYTLVKKTNGKAPDGFLPIYVGEYCERYEIPMEWLSSRRFKAPLHQYEDLIIHSPEPITLPCSTIEFETNLSLVKAETITP